jgi:hypothetical protein
MLVAFNPPFESDAQTVLIAQVLKDCAAIINARLIEALLDILPVQDVVSFFCNHDYFLDSANGRWTSFDGIPLECCFLLSVAIVQISLNNFFYLCNRSGSPSRTIVVAHGLDSTHERTVFNWSAGGSSQTRKGCRARELKSNCRSLDFAALRSG